MKISAFEIILYLGGVICILDMEFRGDIIAGILGLLAIITAYITIIWRKIDEINEKLDGVNNEFENNY